MTLALRWRLARTASAREGFVCPPCDEPPQRHKTLLYRYVPEWTLARLDIEEIRTWRRVPPGKNPAEAAAAGEMALLLALIALDGYQFSRRPRQRWFLRIVSILAMADPLLYDSDNADELLAVAANALVVPTSPYFVQTSQRSDYEALDLAKAVERQNRLADIHRKMATDLTNAQVGGRAMVKVIKAFKNKLKWERRWRWVLTIGVTFAYTPVWEHIWHWGWHLMFGMVKP